MKNLIYKFFLKFLIFSIYSLNFFLKKLNKDNFLQEVSESLDEKKYISVEINQKKASFYCPSTLSHARVKKLFTKEPETIDWINKFINKDKIIFWDIGANIGVYSIYAGIKYENIEIISFEPSTSNTRLLSRNIFINKLQNKIKIFQLALTDNENIISTFKETNFQEGGSLSTFKENFDYNGNIILNNKIENEYKIFGTSIDFIIKNNVLNIPDYLKCDVDGIEHYILNGASTLLESPRLKEISIEINPKFIHQFDEVTKKLYQNNFKIVSYNDKKIISEEFFLKQKPNGGNILFKKFEF